MSVSRLRAQERKTKREGEEREEKNPRFGMPHAMRTMVSDALLVAFEPLIFDGKNIGSGV